MFAGLFHELASRAHWRREPLPETLEKIAEENAACRFLSELLNAFRETRDLASAWLRAVASPAVLRLLHPAEAEVLRAFPSTFQCASGVDFAEICLQSAAAFDGFAETAAAERVRQTRLWMGLGAFGALLTVIVLI